MRLLKLLLILFVFTAAALPVWAQAAFDDADAQLRVRQAATAASAAARKVETLRKELDAERRRIVQTESERDRNQTDTKALEQDLSIAETKQREQDAALKAAQDARAQGRGNEAVRRESERRQAVEPTAAATLPRAPDMSTNTELFAVYCLAVTTGNARMFRDGATAACAAGETAHCENLHANLIYEEARHERINSYVNARGVFSAGRGEMAAVERAMAAGLNDVNTCMAYVQKAAGRCPAYCSLGNNKGTPSTCLRSCEAATNDSCLATIKCTDLSPLSSK